MATVKKRSHSGSTTALRYSPEPQVVKGQHFKERKKQTNKKKHHALSFKLLTVPHTHTHTHTQTNKDKGSSNYRKLKGWAKQGETNRRVVIWKSVNLIQETAELHDRMQ